MKQVVFYRQRIWLAALLATLLWTANGAPLQAADSIQPAAPAANANRFLPLLRNGQAPLCRFGVNGALKSYPIKPLRIGWYVDYAASRTANPPQGIAYYPMIRLEQVGDSYRYSIFGESRLPTTDAQLGAVIAAHPGAYWFVGNEPDRSKYQDDLEPHIYAKAYHDLYLRIKGQDPTAKIVAGTIVQPTPLRLQYLDMVLSAYRQQYGQRMPVDVWSFHNFILNERSCEHFDALQCWGAEIPPGIDAIEGFVIEIEDRDLAAETGDIEIFKDHVIAFRRWLADHGYRNVPVFLSEYGILMPERLGFPEAKVNAFMDASFDFLLNATDPEIGYPADNNRLVQRFSWYSVDDKEGFNGYLFDPASGRSAYGTNFAEYTEGVADEVDWLPVRLEMAGQSGSSMTLRAVIANSGNLQIPQTAGVRFYRGDPARGGVPIGEPTTVTLAGCGEQQTVTLTWQNATPGSHDIYVVVDWEQRVAETNEGNNTLRASVSLATAHAQMPLVLSPDWMN